MNLAAQRLAVFEKSLKTALLQQPVLHADEPGSKANGKLYWLHVVSCAQITLYGPHEQRGIAALQEMEVLPQFMGVVVLPGARTSGYPGNTPCVNLISCENGAV